MDGGSLNFDEFMAMPRKEQNVRYKDLSEHDKFRARLADVSTKEVFIPCNYCAHYRGFGKCDAYPNGTPREIVDAIMNDQDYKCSKEIHFEHMGHKWKAKE